MWMSNPNPSGRKANFAPEREGDESDTAGIVLHGRRSLFALYHRTARAIHPDFFFLKASSLVFPILAVTRLH